jgi:Zn-dependent protease
VREAEAGWLTVGAGGAGLAALATFLLHPAKVAHKANTAIPLNMFNLIVAWDLSGYQYKRIACGN